MKGPTPPPILRKQVASLISVTLSRSGDTPIIAAVSGGPDSVALLHLLCAALPLNRVIAVYVDHGLRPHETPAEIELVASLADRLHAGFETMAVDVEAEIRLNRTSIEEAARTLRYQALESARVRHRAAAIAVAHTADDQAEELLIRLIRGCGRKGLAGMQVLNGWIFRPLLGTSKEDLLAYLRTEQLPFCLDSSNLERVHLRNKVRLDLLPYLREHFNPSIRQTLLHTARILADEEALLEEMTDRAWQETVSMVDIPPVSCRTPPFSLTLDIRRFSRLPDAIQRRILERCCWQMENRPQFRQIASLLDLALKKTPGAQIHLSRGLRARKTGGCLIFAYPAGKGSCRGRLEPV